MPGAGAAAGSNRARSGLFGTTRDLVAAGTPEPEQPVGHRRVDGEDAVRRGGSRSAPASRSRPVGERVRGAREAHPEELRHRLVEVEDHRHAGEPERQRGEHEEVRQACGPGRARSGAADGRASRPGGPDEEREVLAQVAPRPAPWWRWTSRRWTRTPSSQPSAASPRAARREDVDRPARGDERLGLAPDARILVVVGVDDHRDRPARPARGLTRSRRSSRRRAGAPGAAGSRGRASC